MPEETVNNGVKKFQGTPIKGNRVWYFIQSVKAAIGSPALLPAFQTEGTTTIGGDNIDEQTKMGRIILKSTDEHAIELTQYFAPDDESIQIIEDAKKNGGSVKVWRVIVDESMAEDEGESTKAYPAKFGYGIPDELEYDEGEDLVEISYTLNIIGKLQDGTFPLSNEDVAMIESLYQYQRPGETTGDYSAIDDGTTTTTTTTEAP
ncbi:phage major tail protein, TP901-1 family [Enterococcus faecium]|uniref:phage major tail protein, TP901-1 family n=1 Tax=Enterococcus faecium TaxID=1352 RepID=UPI000BF05112|nr:phage major tail protein, TP901-1 family [Enterococcus faecium]PEH49304.1 phage major tail protein, TP901-1 family [Enterococcus faecium]